METQGKRWSKTALPMNIQSTENTLGPPELPGIVASAVMHMNLSPLRSRHRGGAEKIPFGHSFFASPSSPETVHIGDAGGAGPCTAC